LSCRHFVDYRSNRVPMEKNTSQTVRVTVQKYDSAALTCVVKTAAGFLTPAYRESEIEGQGAALKLGTVFIVLVIVNRARPFSTKIAKDDYGEKRRARARLRLI
jgi:hypothetical protein